MASICPPDNCRNCAENRKNHKPTMTDRKPGFWHTRIVSDLLVVRIVQAASFLAAAIILLMALQASVRLASTPGDVLIGILGGSAVVLLLVVLGVVLPFSVHCPDFTAKGDAAASREL